MGGGDSDARGAEVFQTAVTRPPFGMDLFFFSERAVPTAGCGKLTYMGIDDVAQLAEDLSGVRRTTRDGLAQWRYHGRLVARQLDDAHVVIRADFGYRDAMLRQFPQTFSVPARYAKHMMIVADIAGGDAGAIEDALDAAWRLQRDAG